MHTKHLRLLIVLKDHCYTDLKTHLGNDKHIARFVGLQKRITKVSQREMEKKLAIINAKYQDRIQNIINNA